MDIPISYERYNRQMILKGFGEAGQRKLWQAKVLVIGAGGLGCPALQYLTAAGVGTIGIVDDDVVSLSNLHRQVLYSVQDIGMLKAEKAAQVLRNLNPEIEIVACSERLSTQNALSILQGYDIIIDGTDNFSSRYMINDACVLLNKPLVYGAVSQYEGQASVFNYNYDGKAGSVNYRDLFPHPPKENEVPNCSTAGVLGVLPGIIGAMQANETIKLLTGIGEPLINRLLTYSALNNQFYEVELYPGVGTRSLIPSSKEAFMEMDYDWVCGIKDDRYEIESQFFDDLLASGDLDALDVREPGELPAISEFACRQIPLSQLSDNRFQIKSNTIVTICQSGKRSLQAARQLAAMFESSKRVFSLRGGIIQWKRLHSKQLL